MSPVMLILKQTVRLSFRKGGGALGCVAFYIIAVTLFTFALGPEAMHESGGPVLCVAMLLASVTLLPLYFERDHEDGTLEQLLLSPAMLEMLVLAKILGQWISSMLPLLVVSPLLAISMGLEGEMGQVLWPLLLASPTVVALGAVAAALTLGTKRGGLLQALIVLPLQVPVLIFAALGNQPGALLLLSGIMFASVPLSCWVSAALIKLSAD